MEIALHVKDPLQYGDVKHDRLAAIIEHCIRNGEPAEGILPRSAFAE